MKKFLVFFGTALIMTVPAMAQGDSPAGDLNSFFTTFGALVGLIPVATHFVLKIIKKDSATPNLVVQIISWSMGLVITMFGWALQLGFLAGLTWYWALLYGIGASLAANGVADTKIIQGFFALFKKK